MLQGMPPLSWVRLVDRGRAKPHALPRRFPDQRTHADATGQAALAAGGGMMHK
jgi:hypothetical protein